MNAVSFNANNGQLEVVPQAFVGLKVFPFSIVWHIKVGDTVTDANQVLGQWMFSKPSTLPPDIVCPNLVGKRLVLFNNGTDFSQLDEVPAQVLAFFA